MKNAKLKPEFHYFLHRFAPASGRSKSRLVQLLLRLPQANLSERRRHPPRGLRKGNHMRSCLLTYLRSEVTAKAACKCDRIARRVNIYENELRLSSEVVVGSARAAWATGACQGVGIGIVMHIKCRQCHGTVRTEVDIAFPTSIPRSDNNCDARTLEEQKERSSS